MHIGYFILGLPCALVLSVLLADPRPLPLLWVLVGACGSVWLLLTARPASVTQQLRNGLLLVMALALGWQLAGIGNQRFAPWQLEAGQQYRIRAVVDGLPESNYYRHRIRVQPDCMSVMEGDCTLFAAANRLWPLYLEISIPRKLFPEPPMPGQAWEISARFQPLSPQNNPGTFNPLRWYKASHVVARFEVDDGGSMRLLEDSSDWLERARFALRQALVRQSEQAGTGSRVAGLPVLLALVTGDRSQMTPQHWEIFNATGTTHLVAISGSHIVLVAGVMMFLLQRLLRRWLWLTHRVPASHPAAVGAFVVAWLYAAIAGFGLPVQRALVMLAVFVILKLLGRVQQLWFALALAFLLVLVWDPMAPFAIGFWLSFMAVYLIIWMSGGRVTPIGVARGWVRVQVGIFLGLAPVLLWQIQNLSLVSCITNVFAIPLVGMVLTPLALVWALLWGGIGDVVNPLLTFTGWLADLMIVALDWFASLRYSVLHVPARPALAMLLALAGVIWLCTAGLPARWLGLVLLAPLLKPTSDNGGVWVRDSGGPLQLAIDSPADALFVSESGWPRLLAPWQQAFLNGWGIGTAGSALPVQNASAAWAANGWVLMQLPLQRNLLGERRAQRIRFHDLCAEDAEAGPETVRWQLLLPAQRGRNCVVSLQLAQQHWLMFPGVSLRAQRQLLADFKIELAAHQVLLNPNPQDKLLPALVQYWQQQGSELLLTQEPPETWRELFERKAVRFRVLSTTGALHIAADWADTAKPH